MDRVAMGREAPLVSADELIQHRLKTLEDIGVGARETERRVDVLTLSFTNVERDIADIAAAVKALHQRLDEITRDESFEKGREAGTKASFGKTWKVIGYTVTATLMALGVAVATLNLILN